MRPQAKLVRSDDTWQVAWDRTVVEPSLKGGTVLDLTPIAARRGDITGADGLALVTLRPVVRVGLDKGRIPKAQLVASAEAMAQLVDIDVKPYVELAKAAGDLAFVEAIVYRQDEIPAEVAVNADTIKGGMLVSDDIPLGPTRGFATPIIGTVGEVTAEMIKDQPDLYEVGDQAGLSGLQQRYDAQLQGTPGAVVNAVASDDKERELFRVDARQGKTLELTMDLDLQLEAESAARRRRPGECAGRDPPEHRGDPGGRQRTRHQRLQHGDVRPVRSRLDVQERQQPGAAARRRRPRDHRPVYADDHRRRQELQELLRLPVERAGDDRVPHRGGQLLQHRLHRRARPAR